MKNDLREKIRLITGGWLGATLAEYDITPTVGDLSWRTRKINGEIEALFVALLDEVMGKWQSFPDDGEFTNYLHDLKYGYKRAIRDSVSGGE